MSKAYKYDYYRQRAADFRAKAKATSDWLMKRAFEAAAHEYDMSAAEIEHTRPIAQAVFPKPDLKIG